MPAEGRYKPPHKWTPSQRDRDIYDQHVARGRPQVRIAEELGLTRGRICQIVGAVDAWLAARFKEDIDQYKRQATIRLSHLYEEAMEGWRRSQQPAETVKTITGGDEGERREVTVKPQAGDPRFLEQARAAVAEQLALWGAYAPKQVAHSGAVATVGVDVAGLTEAQQAEILGLAGMLAAAEQRTTVDGECRRLPQRGSDDDPAD